MFGVWGKEGMYGVLRARLLLHTYIGTYLMSVTPTGTCICTYVLAQGMHIHTSGLAFSRLISFPFLFISKPLVTLDYVLTYIPRLTCLAYA